MGDFTQGEEGPIKSFSFKVLRQTFFSRYMLVNFYQLGPLGRVGLVVSMSVCLSVYRCVVLRHRVQLFLRPLIGPHVT